MADQTLSPGGAGNTEEIPMAGPETPTGHDEAALVEQAKRWYKVSMNHFSDWRQQADEDYGFVAGDQWTAEDKGMLEEQNRPIITFNRIGPTTDAVTGLEVGNRQELRFIPRQGGKDAGINEVLTGAAEWVRDQCDAEDEESEAFSDTVICGMGWTETRMDYEAGEEGMIMIERVDPFEMHPDPRARKRNLTDARWLLRVKDFSLDEAMEIWPGKEDELSLAEPWAEQGSSGSADHDAYEAKFYRHDQGPSLDDVDTRPVRVIEMQWWELETYYRVVEPTTGQLTSMSAEKYKKLTERLEPLGITLQAMEQKQRKYFRAFIAGEYVLEESPCPYDKGFTYRAITGKRDRNEGIWYGVVRMMKDPQRWANKWLSQVLHIINSNAKGGLMAEKGAFDNARRAEEEWSDPTAITWMSDGAISGKKIEYKPSITYPSGLDKMMEFAVSSIRDVSGINLELLGMADRDQPGIVESQRKQAGMTILAVLFGSLRRYRKEQGRLLLHFIRSYISDGRLIKVVQEGTEQYIPLVRQDDTYEFDVIVDDAPSSPNQKEKVWALMSQMLPILTKLEIPPQVWLDLITYSPFPDSLIQKITKAMKEQAEAPPDPMQEIAVAGAQADVEETKSKAMLNQAKAQGEQVDAKVEAAGAGLTPPIDPLQQAKAETERLKAQLLMSEANAKIAQDRADYLLDQQLNQAKMETERAKAAASLVVASANVEAKELTSKAQAKATLRPKPKAKAAKAKS